MKDKIRALRKKLNLTQHEFADRIGISRNNVATYEFGKSKPSDAVVSLICRTYHVREEWLREGIEPMFAEPSNNVEQVKEWVDGIFEKGSTFEQSFIKSMSTFTPREWHIMARFIRRLEKEQRGAEAINYSPDAPPPEGLTKEEWALILRRRRMQSQQPICDAARSKDMMQGVAENRASYGENKDKT